MAGYPGCLSVFTYLDVVSPMPQDTLGSSQDDANVSASFLVVWTRSKQGSEKTSFFKKRPTHWAFEFYWILGFIVFFGFFI